MIRSVGAGSTGLSNQTRRKTPQEKTIPFPKVGDGPITLNNEEIQEASSSKAPLMVGVKVKSELKSIFDEVNGVVKLNSDGDRLEVSKRAISIAKEKLFY